MRLSYRLRNLFWCHHRIFHLLINHFISMLQSTPHSSFPPHLVCFKAQLPTTNIIYIYNWLSVPSTFTELDLCKRGYQHQQQNDVFSSIISLCFVLYIYHSSFHTQPKNHHNHNEHPCYLLYQAFVEETGGEASFATQVERGTTKQCLAELDNRGRRREHHQQKC